MAEKIGFIGLGIMGRGMAANLLAKGFDVAVWNRTARRADGLVEAGAARAESPAAVAQSCPVVITCVSDTPDVEAVVLGPGGVIEGVSSGSLVIDCSTISPQATLEIAKALEAKGASMLDAPISGGSEGAEKGTLSIMVGGRAEDFERARPCLEAMGTTITHVGTQGAGQTVKLVNQILVVGNCVAMCEALLFAQAGGVDLQKTFDAISQGAAGSWMFTNRAPQIIQRDWSPGFMVSLQQKDLRLVLAAADEMGVPIPVTAQIFNLYRTLEARGLYEEGNHALIKALEHLSGIEVGAET
ncbi:MAG: NAD(P)-dependent oxidoreductase [Caldilineaceae bacterium SB0665_bin_21]|nr:NAD(P)-dependent oxidoreductase [Caldilineaceae bacterium SB0665_bin_21]MYA04300.1 NAD(P)-dependent oxidoreductase [Caldilineaceae bacterium SB0664_bin_22]